MTKEIQLTKGKMALVDDEDFERIAQHKWQYVAGGYAGRSVRQPRRMMFYMHREIMSAPAGSVVDHINRDHLDNRRGNLRIASTAQNMGNTKRRTDNRAGFKGVSWNKNASKWEAYITICGKRVHLGLFADAETAARVYDAKATECFGEFANLNFQVA